MNNPQESANLETEQHVITDSMFSVAENPGNTPPERKYSIQAEYNLADDTIYAYISERLTPEDYKHFTDSHHARWFPGRKCFAIKWTPYAEDQLLAWDPSLDIVSDIAPDDVVARIERFEGYSASAARSASSANDYAHSIIDGIPMGQPILVGHHSEKRDRATRARAESAMRRSLKESERAQYWNNRIAGAISRAEQKEQPGTIKRRIDGFAAALRKHQRDLAKGITDSYSYSLHRELTPAEQVVNWERIQALHHRWIDHYEMLIQFHTALLEAAGGTLESKVAFETGGWVNRGGDRWYKIVKVNPKTLKIETGHMPWPLTIDKSEVKAYRTAAEGRPA